MLRSCLVSRRRVGNEASEGILDRCETEPVGLPYCGTELGFPAERRRRSTYCSSAVDCERLASQNARCSVSGDLDWRLGAETEFGTADHRAVPVAAGNGRYVPSGWLQSTQRVLRPFLLSKVIRK